MDAPLTEQDRATWIDKAFTPPPLIVPNPYEPGRRQDAAIFAFLRHLLARNDVAPARLTGGVALRLAGLPRFVRDIDVRAGHAFPQLVRDITRLLATPHRCDDGYRWSGRPLPQQAHDHGVLWQPFHIHWSRGGHAGRFQLDINSAGHPPHAADEPPDPAGRWQVSPASAVIVGKLHAIVTDPLSTPLWDHPIKGAARVLVGQWYRRVIDRSPRRHRLCCDLFDIAQARRCLPALDTQAIARSLRRTLETRHKPVIRHLSPLCFPPLVYRSIHWYWRSNLSGTTNRLITASAGMREMHAFSRQLLAADAALAERLRTLCIPRRRCL